MAKLSPAMTTALPRSISSGTTAVGMSWMWTLAFDYHEDRTPTHGYEATREAAMAAFAKSLAAGVTPE